jgi:DNA repair protein RadC
MVKEIPIVETYLKRINHMNGFNFKGITTPEEAAEIMYGLVGNSPQESFVVICIDTKGYPTNISLVYKGTSNEIRLSPKDIFRVAILSNSSDVIIGHNHPSGNLEISAHDKETTRKLIESGNHLDIRILDHIIIGNGYDYISLKEKGVI